MHLVLSACAAEPAVYGEEAAGEQPTMRDSTRMVDGPNAKIGSTALCHVTKKSRTHATLTWYQGAKRRITHVATPPHPTPPQ